MCAAEWPLFTGHFLRKRKNISTSAKGIEAVAPPLRHLHALLPMLPAMVRRPHLVGISVGQCALYGIGRPFARLVEQGRGHRPEAMRRHLVGSVTQPPHRPVDRVFAHRAGPRTNRGEYISRSDERRVGKECVSTFRSRW